MDLTLLEGPVLTRQVSGWPIGGSRLLLRGGLLWPSIIGSDTTQAPFNSYADEVTGLYSGMDLPQWF